MWLYAAKSFNKTVKILIKMAKKMRNVKKNVGKDLFTFNNAVLFALMLALIVLFKTILGSVATFKTAEKADLEQEAKTLLDTVTAEGKAISLVESNELLEEKVKSLGNMDYDEFKNTLGLKSDFCIYFEDASGNLIKVNGIELGIGSEKIKINGKPCE